MVNLIELLLICFAENRASSNETRESLKFSAIKLVFWVDDMPKFWLIGIRSSIVKGLHMILEVEIQLTIGISFVHSIELYSLYN